MTEHEACSSGLDFIHVLGSCFEEYSTCTGRISNYITVFQRNLSGASLTENVLVQTQPLFLFLFLFFTGLR